MQQLIINPTSNKVSSLTNVDKIICTDSDVMSKLSQCNISFLSLHLNNRSHPAHTSRVVAGFYDV